MQKITKYLSSTGTWVASTTLAPINLPLEGIITEVLVRATVTATLTAAAVQDATRRVLDTLRIEGDGLTFLPLDVSGGTGAQLGRLLALLNQFDCKGAATRANLADIGTTSFDQCFVFHPGSNPKDPFDLSAGIPAKRMSSLTATIGCPAAAVTDGSGNITACTYQLTVNQVVGDDAFRPTMMVPSGQVQVWSPDANYASWGKALDIPGGKWLRRIVIMSQDETATTPLRVDTLMTGLGIEMPLTSQTLIKAYLLDLKAMMSRRYGNPGSVEDGVLGATAGAPPSARPGFSGAAFMPKGFVIIDLRDYANPVWGLDLTKVKSGDLHLTLTYAGRAASQAVYIYWDQFQPIPAKYLVA